MRFPLLVVGSYARVDGRAKHVHNIFRWCLGFLNDFTFPLRAAPRDLHELQVELWSKSRLTVSWQPCGNTVKTSMQALDSGTSMISSSSSSLSIPRFPPRPFSYSCSRSTKNKLSKKSQSGFNSKIVKSSEHHQLSQSLRDDILHLCLSPHCLRQCMTSLFESHSCLVLRFHEAPLAL